MRILHVTSSIDPSLGGISEAILRLGTAMETMGHANEIVSADDPASPWKSGITLPLHLKGPARGFLESSPGFARWLDENAARFDAIVTHGLWRANSRLARRAARAAGKPYFVMVHGMLDPWFKRYYPLKHALKCLYWWWREYAVLRDARAVLFTCEEERLLARQSFRPYRCRESVVSLGTAPPPGAAAGQRRAFLQTFPALESKRVILFLGRLHVKKGCEMLLGAFRTLLESLGPDERNGFHLMMAGPSFHPAYLDELKTIAAACDQLSPGSVSFPGMLTGDLKWGALRQAEVFALPSHQENFGVAVAEALACGTPVLISRPVNIWREIEADGAGLVDADTEAGCLRLLRRWLALPPGEREQMRDRAAACFTKRFEITQAAAILLKTLQDPA